MTEQKTVRKLERELEDAIAGVVCRSAASVAEDDALDGEGRCYCLRVAGG